MKKAFSLLELLCVLAVIAILIGITIPIVNGIRRQAAIVQTKARFQRWGMAMEAFRYQYGEFPQLGDSPVSVNEHPGRWLEILTGRDILGGTASDPVAIAQNTDLIKFIDFSQEELDEEGRLLDAFGRSDIVAYFDQDKDGFLEGLDSVRGQVGFKSEGDPEVTSY